MLFISMSSENLNSNEVNSVVEGIAISMYILVYLSFSRVVSNILFKVI